LSLLFSGFKGRNKDTKIRPVLDQRATHRDPTFFVRHQIAKLRCNVVVEHRVQRGRISPIPIRERTRLYPYTDRNLAARTILSGNRMHIKPLHFHL